MKSHKIAFVLVQILFFGTVLTYGRQRFELMTTERELPVPNMEPIQLKPRYDRPDLLSDDELTALLKKLEPRLRGSNPKINHVDHALRFWGVASRFEDERCYSGVEMRDLLLDHRAFQSAWGTEEEPFLLPDFRGDTPLLSMRTKDGAASASHTDHSLASLAECQTPLDFPVITPEGELPLETAFQYSLTSFRLNQDEYEWSTIIFLHYLPHVDAWYSVEGQRITWDHLADRLMRQRLSQGVCFGNHRLYALVAMLNVDETHGLLSDAGRERVIAHLRDVTDRLITTQLDSGAWNGNWPGEEWDGPPVPNGGPLGETADQILATGHALEWWAFAPEELLPPDATIQNAILYLQTTIHDLDESETRRYYTFLTHAGRALSLWRGLEPYDFVKQHAMKPEADQNSAE